MFDYITALFYLLFIVNLWKPPKKRWLDSGCKVDWLFRITPEIESTIRHIYIYIYMSIFVSVWTPSFDINRSTHTLTDGLMRFFMFVIQYSSMGATWSVSIPLLM